MAQDLARIDNKNGLEAMLYSDKMQKSLKEIAANVIDPVRFCKMVLVAFSKSPNLYKCEPTSIMKSLMDAAELGLDPSGTLGKAYLIPYGKQAQLIIGYRGLVELAKRNKEVKAIKAVAVYENDKFEINELADPPIIHKPELKGDRGEFMLAYAYARFDDGTLQYEWMSKQEIDSIRNRSKAAKSGPWVTDYMEMAKKTVIRRLCKMLPMVVDVLEIENKDFDAFETIDTKPAMGSDAVADKLKKTVESDEVVELDTPVDDPQDTKESTDEPQPDEQPPINPPEDVSEPKPLRYYCHDCDHEDAQCGSVKKTGALKCLKCLSTNILDREE